MTAEPDFVMRWVVAQANGNFAHARQGRNTYDTQEEAQAWINAALESNGPERLAFLYAMPLEPALVRCHAGHHDPAEYPAKYGRN